MMEEGEGEGEEEEKEKVICLFHYYSLSRVHGRVFYGLCLCDVWYCNRVNVKEDIKTQLSPIKVDIKEICKR